LSEDIQETEVKIQENTVEKTEEITEQTTVEITAEDTEEVVEENSVESAAKDATEAVKDEISDEIPKKKRRFSIGRYIGQFFLLLISIVLVCFIGLYSLIYVICHGPSQTAGNLFVSTILETGAMQFLASWYYSEEEIMAITNQNSMIGTEENVNTELVVPQKGGADMEGEADFDLNAIEIYDVNGRTFAAKMMVVNDPSRVKVSTIYPWSDENHSKNGIPLEDHVKKGDNIGGINAGIYVNGGHWGGRPKGLVVCEGEIQFNEPEPGDVMIGFNEDNILVIQATGNMTAKEVEQLVKDEKIRDAVTFKDEMNKDSNHFTQLIINGKAREINGNGSGANPRTAIGQRADGAVLLLVTDGRGASGHLGATASDLLSIMQQYGAVNAANLDGGSSSAMYYEDHYEMNSVTLVYSTDSWNLPTTLVVERRD